MKRPLWFSLFQILYYIILPVFIVFTGLKLIGLAKSIVLASPVFWGITLWSMLLYYWVWGWLSRRFRLQYNNASVDPTFERAELEKVLDTLHGASSDKAKSILQNYMAHLFVRRAYAVQDADLPHPFLDPLYREAMLDVLPASIHFSPGKEEEVSLLEATLGRLEDMEGVPEGRTLPKVLRQHVAECMETIDGFWEITPPTEKAASEIVEALNLKRKRHWADYVVPFLATIRDWKLEEQKGRLEGQIENFYQGRAILPPLATFFDPDPPIGKRGRGQRKEAFPVFPVVFAALFAAAIIGFIIAAAMTIGGFSLEPILEEGVDIAPGEYKCFEVKKTGYFKYTLASSEPVDTFMLPALPGLKVRYRLSSDKAIREYLAEVAEHDTRMKKVKAKPAPDYSEFDAETAAMMKEMSVMLGSDVPYNLLYRATGSARKTRSFATERLGPSTRVNWILIHNPSKKTARVQVTLEWEEN